MNPTNPAPSAPQTGFSFKKFENSFEVTVFPNPSDPFEPTKGMAIGEETCNKFGTKRLVVRYSSLPIRKSTKKEEFWPGDTLYLEARYVSGWNV